MARGKSNNSGGSYWNAVNFSRQETGALLLFFMLLLAFNLIFVKAHGWAHVWWSLVGYASLLAIYLYARLKPSDVGLAKQSVKPGLKYASYAVGAVLAFMFIAYVVDPNIFKDSRYNQNLSAALFAALVLLPLKTVLFEELAFRGLFPALLLKHYNSRYTAAIISSLIFGLWHMSTLPNNRSLILIAPVTFMATFLAGLAFCWLRFKSGSLLAPIAAHWCINAAAIILASLAWRS